MASKNVSQLTNLATPQPTMLLYAALSPFGVTDDRKITANALLATITQNISDISLQFDDGLATATVSAAGKGKLRYNDTAKVFQFSADGAAYVTFAAGGSGTVNAGTQFQFTYYAANGTTVDGNAFLTTDASNRIKVNAVTFNNPAGGEVYSFGAASPNGAIMEFGDFANGALPVLYFMNAALTKIAILAHIDGTDFVTGTLTNTGVQFKQNNATRLSMDTTNLLTVAAAAQFQMLNAATGAGTALIGAANFPGANPAAVTEWAKVKTSGGVDGWIPVWT